MCAEEKVITEDSSHADCHEKKGYKSVAGGKKSGDKDMIQKKEGVTHTTE